MKSFKIHLSLIVPLLFMMLAFEFLIISYQTMSHYESKLGENYSIIIVSQKDLNQSVVKSAVSSMNSLQKMDTKDFVTRLKDNISASNLSTLQKNLPKFYTLKLAHFPSENELNDIKNRLLKLDGVSKVEVFLKTYSQIHTLLSLVNVLLSFFLIVIILLSFSLFLKQMRIWLYEHTERIEIMCLFGAPFLFRAKMLYNIVFIDCLVAFAILLIFFTQLFSLSIVQKSLEFVGVILPEMNFFLHLGVIFLATLLVCFICVNSVMFRVKK